MTKAGTKSSRRTRQRDVANARMRQLAKLIARYDAAQTTHDNRRYWSAADNLSADAANSPAVRSVLRARSRYEAANNSYLRGMLRKLSTHLIGSTPHIQFTVDDEPLNDLLEDMFRDWSKAVGFGQKLRLARKCKARDGEIFIVLVNNPLIRHDVKLDLRLIEAEQCATPDASEPRERSVDGIELDEFDNPVRYAFLNAHPGGGRYTASYSWEPARNVIHWFDADRPGQHRGIPETTTALTVLPVLRRYMMAVLSAAETAANFAVLLKTELPEVDDDETALQPLDTHEIERNMMTVLPNGATPTQLKPEQPTATHEAFVASYIQEIAAGIGPTYNIASGNSSGYNFASGRLDHLLFFRDITVEREDLDSIVLSRIIRAWFEEAQRVSGLLPQQARARDFSLSYEVMYDAIGSVDEAKAAAAQERRLANKMSNLKIEYAREGRDWRRELNQIAREAAYMRELGLAPGEVSVQDE